MKNRGISLITLLITVIVMLVLASISTYTGVNMIADAKESSAKDKLKTICSAILKNDSFLSFGAGEPGEQELSLADFEFMNLKNDYDEESVVTVARDVNSTTDASGRIMNRKYLYTLTLTDTKSHKTYEYQFDYSVANNRYHYDVVFDESNGINRPIVMESMVAMMPDEETEVNDIYLDNWYSYNSSTIRFAKMKYNDKIYVWIPRFAYSIQSFYDGRKIDEVPASAVKIVFLRGKSKYMSNDEVMGKTYKVHPAFSQDGVEYAGLWVEKDVRPDKTMLTSYRTNALNIQDPRYSTHMMTSTECGALLLLLHSIGGSTDIVFDKDEYVAASYVTEGLFDLAEGFVTVYPKNDENTFDINSTYGDALIETPWNRTTETYPVSDKPYLIRKFTSGRFDFTNSNGSDSVSYRGVIRVGAQSSVGP